LNEAIESFEDVRRTEEDVCSAPLSIKELHEFLTVEGKGFLSQTFKLWVVDAYDTISVQKRAGRKGGFV